MEIMKQNDKQQRHSPSMQKQRHSTDQEIISLRSSPTQQTSSPSSPSKTLNSNLQTVDESLITCSTTNSKQANNLLNSSQSVYMTHNNQMQNQQLNMQQMNPALHHHLQNHQNYSQQSSNQQFLVHQPHMNYDGENVNSGDDDDDEDDTYLSNHQNCIEIF